MNLSLRGLDKNITVWVSDDRSDSVKKAKGPAEERELRFRPLGGRRYYLTFVFGSEVPQGPLSFSLQMFTDRAPEERPSFAEPVVKDRRERQSKPGR